MGVEEGPKGKWEGRWEKGKKTGRFHVTGCSMFATPNDCHLVYEQNKLVKGKITYLKNGRFYKGTLTETGKRKFGKFVLQKGNVFRGNFEHNHLEGRGERVP